MAQQKLNATVQIGSVLERSVKKNIGLLRSGLEGVGKEIKAVTDRQKELSKQRKVLEKQGRSVADLDREYEELGRTLDGLRQKQERWARAAKASQRVGQDFRGMTADVGRVARNAAVGIGAAGAAVVGIARGTAEAAREVEQMSAMANANTTEFQRMAIAAESVGIEQDKLGDILKDVNDRVGDFLETGGGPMADFFENIAPKVGVTIDQFKELSGPEVLQLYVTSLDKAGVSQQQMTFYMEAMASDATALVPLLRDNGTELKRLGDRGERAGRILDRVTIEAAKEFRASLAEMKGGLTGVRNTLGKEFMPVVGHVMDRFNGYLRTNQDEVKKFAATAGQSLERAIPVIGEVASGMGSVAGKVSEVTAKVAEMAGGWENFGVIIGGIFASKAILGVGRFVLSVGRLGAAMIALAPSLPVVAGGIKAIGLALTANPIGLAVAAIAGGAALVYKYWEPISGFFSRMWGWVKEKFDAARVWVGEAITEFGNVTGITAAWQSVKAGLGAVMDWIGEKFDWVMRKIEPVIDALKWVRDKAGAALEKVGIGGGGPEPAALGSAAHPFPKGHPMHQPQKRAVGGSFRPGGLMVGEQGRELMFANRSGFIATNRATERIAALAKTARADMASALSGAAGASGGSAAASVTNHIQINAAGMSPQSLIDELERRMRDASAGAL